MLVQMDSIQDKLFLLFSIGVLHQIQQVKLRYYLYLENLSVHYQGLL